MTAARISEAWTMSARHTPWVCIVAANNTLPGYDVAKIGSSSSAKNANGQKHSKTRFGHLIYRTLAVPVGPCSSPTAIFFIKKK
jgi:hypothetical protein